MKITRLHPRLACHPAASILVLAILSLLAAAIIPAASAPSDLPATFVTLGTGGGPMIRAERSEPANAVVVGKAVYLFDVGNGVQRQMYLAHLPLTQVRAIFISHHHNDHNADLGAVIVNRWVSYDTKPLPVIGPFGTVAMIRFIADSNFATELAPQTEGGPPLPPIASTVAAQDLPRDMNTPTVIYQDENIRVLAITNMHYHFSPGSEDQKLARTYAYRIETAHRVFVFTGDTGVSANVETLAHGADVLVSEVIDLAATQRSIQGSPLGQNPQIMAGLMRHMREDHLTPVQVGALAQDANVKEVVLTHLAPGLDGETDLSGYTRGIDQNYHGPVHIARDLDQW